MKRFSTNFVDVTLRSITKSENGSKVITGFNPLSKKRIQQLSSRPNILYSKKDESYMLLCNGEQMINKIITYKTNMYRITKLVKITERGKYQYALEIV